MTALPARRNLQGNEACALGAVAAGCRFFAGYPITPSSEIAERMAVLLPKAGGVFVQMEDEIASMGAVVGAALGGAKAMTATSGPGFSLKQENLGYAAAAEVPCVVVDVMRGGPSTGMPTRPSQGDVMQARWGTHGDHPIIVLAPASVEEVYLQTARGFALAERLRVPVILLYDEAIGHLTETVTLPDPATLAAADRPWATAPREKFQPYAETSDLVPPMARPGDGYRTHVTGLTHGADGFPSQNPAVAERASRRLLDKLQHHRGLIEAYESDAPEGPAEGPVEVLVVAYGIVARAAQRAVAAARAAGIAAALFRPITLWPFPEAAFAALAGRARRVLVPEMNAGQLALEIERLAPRGAVSRLNQIDGRAIAPETIRRRIEELAGDGRIGR